MISKQQIHTFTSNFPILQGLKAVPLGMFLLITVVWANQQTGGSRDLTLMFIVTAAMGMFYWFVDKYYELSFGKVERSSKTKSQDLVVSTAAGVLGLASFILDTVLDLPFSLIGLMWMILLVFDGVRIRRSLPGKSFPFFWIFAALLGFLSLLPILGIHDWWLKLGFLDQSLAILTAVSLVTVISGFLWHASLTRNLAIGESE